VIEDDKRSVRARVERLARENRVTYVETEADVLAGVIARLADDEIVNFDETEKLLSALVKAKKIDMAEALSLFVEYVKERRSGLGAGPGRIVQPPMAGIC
jgi:hypothetical protein